MDTPREPLLRVFARHAYAAAHDDHRGARKRPALPGPLFDLAVFSLFLFLAGGYFLR
jgi:hypothetical protein